MNPPQVYMCSPSWTLLFWNLKDWPRYDTQQFNIKRLLYFARALIFHICLNKTICIANGNSYFCIAIICPKQSLLLIRVNLGQGVKILIHFHFERSFKHETFIISIPETDRIEAFIQNSSCPSYIDFVKITPLIRNVDDQLTHRANALDICFKVAILNWLMRTYPEKKSCKAVQAD